VEGAAGLEAEVEGERTPVEPQEREPQPSARGRPACDLRVEATLVRHLVDRGAGLGLPAGPLDREALVEQAVEPLAAVRELESHGTLVLQPALQAPQLLAELARQPGLVVLEAAT